MSVEIICPSCRRTLSVSDDAGARSVTCPACLAVVALPPPLPRDMLQGAPAPMPVIRLDDQVRDDARGGAAALILVCLLVVGGIVLTFATRLPFSPSLLTLSVAA